jgi:tetratricopeptide (TPR) repeat protein
MSHFIDALNAYNSALHELDADDGHSACHIFLAAGSVYVKIADLLDQQHDVEASYAQRIHAVETYRMALAAWSSESKVDRTTIELSLAGVCTTLAEREDGRRYRSEAAAAYRSALKALETKRDLVRWAATQHEFGRALLRIAQGKREADLLDEAATALRSALTVYAPERNPIAWGAAQCDLGVTHHARGQLRSSPTELWLAIKAYREALKVLNEEKAAEQWASTLHNLAIAFDNLAWYDPKPEYFVTAGDSYRAALRVYTVDRDVVRWARVQNEIVALFLRAAELLSHELTAACRLVRDALSRSEDVLTQFAADDHSEHVVSARQNAERARSAFRAYGCEALAATRSGP